MVTSGLNDQLLFTPLDGTAPARRGPTVGVLHVPPGRHTRSARPIGTRLAIRHTLWRCNAGSAAGPLRCGGETDSKLELLRQYPGVLYVDAHEMGANHYFFPPTADPTYHEVTAASMDWQDNLYGGALAAEFDRQHIQYFTNKVFDFFAMVYGDIVPATGFGGAGMTFEKANFDPIAQRTYQHYVTHWVSISQAALNKQAILRRWHEEWTEAYRQGVDGQLEPNEVKRQGQQRPAPGARRAGPPLLPPRRRPQQGG